jgi:hypothetical protein
MNTPSTIAEPRWETRWIAAEGALDPTYERTNAALRRWIDGMERALLTGASSRRAGLSRGLSRGLSSSHNPSRR